MNCFTSKVANLPILPTGSVTLTELFYKAGYLKIPDCERTFQRKLLSYIASLELLITEVPQVLNRRFHLSVDT